MKTAKMKLSVRRQKAVAKLSPRAKQVWERMQRGGMWHGPHDPGLPKCMDELVKAGLVCTIVRAVELRVCYAPVGSKTSKMDTIADYREITA